MSRTLFAGVTIAGSLTAVMSGGLLLDSLGFDLDLCLGLCGLRTRLFTLSSFYKNMLNEGRKTKTDLEPVRILNSAR